jgi:phosphomannomutase/phosphoglucomutase
MLGLMQAGIHVKDIGPALTPMAYFSQFQLDAPAVAMVTANHNPNGWTGVKMGFERPLTHGPDEMNELRDIVLNGHGEPRDGGKYEFIHGVREAYLDDLVGDLKITHKLKVLCAKATALRLPLRPNCLNGLG